MAFLFCVTLALLWLAILKFFPRLHAGLILVFGIAYLVVLDGKGLSTDLTTLQFIEDDRFRDFFHKACLFGQDPGLLAIPRF